MHVNEVVRDEVVRHHYTDGREHRITCPACSAHRRSRTEECLSVRVSNGAVLFHCWHCDLKGIAPMNDTHDRPPPRTVVPMLDPVSSERIVMGPLTTAQQDYLASRGISRGTAQALGLFGGMAWIRDKSTGSGGERSVIGFPYRTAPGAAPYAAKLRSAEIKSFTQKGAAQTFWNIERIPEDSDVVITEGEIDTLSVYESGIQHVVSVPNGAPAPTSVRQDGRLDPKEDGRFGYIFRARKVLDGARRIIIATDNDAPGDALAEELARRIGKHKCYRVSYPEGCKDANDVLVQHGGETLLRLIQNPSPWPVNGLYAADHFFSSLDTLYE